MYIFIVWMFMLTNIPKCVCYVLRCFHVQCCLYIVLHFVLSLAFKYDMVKQWNVCVISSKEFFCSHIEAFLVFGLTHCGSCFIRHFQVSNLFVSVGEHTCKWYENFLTSCSFGRQRILFSSVIILSCEGIVIVLDI